MATLAERIYRAYERLNYHYTSNDKTYNICYLEGVNADGTVNSDRLGHFNDRRIVWAIRGGIPTILGNWLATCEPGLEPTKNPVNRAGAARIEFGQYRAWKVGIHQGSNPKNDHEGLIQVGGPVTVCRDLNKDGIRTGDNRATGYFGINQHHGFNQPQDYVGWASAGCLVGQTVVGHTEFMRLVKSDIRYQANRNFVFETAIINGETQL